MTEAAPPTARDHLARATALAVEDPVAAIGELRRLVTAGDDFAAWIGGARLLDSLGPAAAAASTRQARIAVVGNSTITQLAGLLPLAALRFGVAVEVLETGFDQYRQEILAPDSALHRFSPDVVVIATDEHAAQVPDRAGDPAAVVAAEVERWQSLWRAVAEHSGARVVQHNFAVRPDLVHGHLATRMADLRSSMLGELNRSLAAVAPPGVNIVDCDGLAASFGKDRWFDDRYWYVAKQAVSLAALPALARHTAAAIAAQLGLTRKVLVLDLDGTLWGGIVGEDGLGGIQLGQGSPDGEAFSAFQRYCKALSERGVVLAVCSKNDPDAARLPFRQHPDMVLTEEDIAVFVADWAPKPEGLRHIARTLNLGLGALVFADDNPAERELVRAALPQVEVIDLPDEPSGYVEAVAGSLLFETAGLTDEDRARAAAYQALAAAESLRASASSIEDFHHDLAMTAQVLPFDEVSLPRVVQILAKTNQFNLTTRRHDEDAVRGFMADPGTVTMAIRLRDRLADHGLVVVVIATEDGDTLDVDTWAMSCRVIGRTLERTVLAHLIDEARNRGLRTIRGTYVPTERNRLVASLYSDLGFSRAGHHEETERWVLAVQAETHRNEFVEEPAWAH